MSRLRVLHLVEATTAGVRRYVTTLVHGLADECCADVVCPPIREAHFGDTAFVADMRRAGIAVHGVPLRRSIGWADAPAYRAVARVIRTGRYDLIHTHSSKAGFLGRLAARHFGVPAVHTPNGLYFLEQAGAGRRLFLALEQLAGRWAARLIAVSEGERTVMLDHRLAVPDRIVLIENGVDARRVRAEAESGHAQEGAPPGGSPLVGGAGRMVPQKDPLTFVKMAQRVASARPGARFVWYGDGELRPSVEALARESGVRLTVTGHLENVWAAMKCLDVFVLPSLYEGLPFTLLEAMALGVPVVATDVIGTRDVLRDGSAGWLVPARDPQAMAEAVQAVLTRPGLADGRVEAARRLVETRYSVERMLAAHRELYADVLGARRA